jgi:DNA polymerase theta
MRRAVLDAIASGAVQTPEDVLRYVRCTLLCATEGFPIVKAATMAALGWLAFRGFVW